MFKHLIALLITPCLAVPSAALPGFSFLACRSPLPILARNQKRETRTVAFKSQALALPHPGPYGRWLTTVVSSSKAILTPQEQHLYLYQFRQQCTGPLRGLGIGVMATLASFILPHIPSSILPHVFPFTILPITIGLTGIGLILVTLKLLTNTFRDYYTKAKVLQSSQKPVLLFDMSDVYDPPSHGPNLGQQASA